MKKKGISIAVSGLNATDNPGPGVPVIRSIRKSPEFDGIITGMAFDPLDPGIYMQGICDNVFLMPYPTQGADRLLERIKEIHSKLRLDVIIPTLDSELDAYIRISGELEKMGIRSFLPSVQGLNVRSKVYFERLREMGITVPDGQSIASMTSIYELDKKFKFPVMVKGQFYEAYVAYSPMDAEYYFRKISAKWGLPVVVQEYVVGQEYDVMALGDGRGGLIGAVPIKKIQLTEKGKAWGGNNQIQRHRRLLSYRNQSQISCLVLSVGGGRSESSLGDGETGIERAGQRAASLPNRRHVFKKLHRPCLSHFKIP